MDVINPQNAGLSCAVTVQNGQAVTSSIKVAEIFGKKHKNVVRAIQKIIAEYPQNSGQLIFEPTEYKWTNNLGMVVKSPMYLMNRDGFTLLAFSFTGKKAMQFKVAYINRFNEMEQQILQGNGQHGQQSPADKLSLIVDALGSISRSLQTLALPCPCPEQIPYTPPTYYDVADFIRRNGLHRVNAQKFFTYYASRNWLVDGFRVDWRNLLFSWNQNMIDWERRQGKF